MKKQTLFILAALFLAGCPAKKENVRAVDSRGNLINGSYSAGLCSQGQSLIGTIYDQSMSYTNGTFEDRVKAFLSASIAPEDVGQISSGPTDTTGVRFQGTIKLDASGNVTLAQTKLAIKVYDSYVALGQTGSNGNKFEAIPVEFTQAAEGHFNMQTGEGYVLFRDGYGEFRLEGRIDAQYFSGTASFKNTVNVTGGTPSQAILGQFYVARCAIIQ